MKQNQFVSKKHKKVCKILNHTEHLLISTSTVTGCVSIPTFASFVGFPLGILNLCNNCRNQKLSQQLIKVKYHWSFSF